MITLKVERHQYSETLGFALNTDEDDERAKDSLNGVAATHSVGPVTFGSAGARSGLCEGDVIHAINNKVVDGMSHDDVASLLSSALFEVLTVGRHTSQVGGARNERLTYLTLELDREQPTDPLGMSIVSENGVHEVEEIFENQTASHSGVAFGDRIVSIDGCSVLGMSHDDVLGLMAGKMSIRLSITRAALRDLSHGSVVKLVRNGGGLGMVFATDMHGQGANRQYVHTVEGVIPGGIAEEAGIQTWDHLVTLNGIGTVLFFDGIYTR
jgi:C-terminal processing protease CtpA/Prc